MEAPQPIPREKMGDFCFQQKPEPRGPSWSRGGSSSRVLRSNHPRDLLQNRPTDRSSVLVKFSLQNFSVSVMKGWLASKQTLPEDLLTSIRKDWVRHHIHLLRFTMSISDDSLEYILGSCVGKVKAIELIMASGSIWLLDRTFPSC